MVPMNLSQLSIADIDGVRFVIDLDSEECLLRREWAALYLPSFSAGYKIILATSPYGVFRSMQWMTVTNLSAGIDAVLGSRWLQEFNRYISQHELDESVCSTTTHFDISFLSIF